MRIKKEILRLQERQRMFLTIGRVTKKYRRSLCKMSKKIKVIEMNI